MNPDKFGMLIDLAMWLACLYCLYSWAWMRRHGTIHENPLLVSSKTPVAACRDQAGYLAYMQPRLLLFGLIGSALGGVLFFGNMRGLPGGWWLPVNAVFLVNVVWFALAIRTSIKRFWNEPPPSL